MACARQSGQVVEVCGQSKDGQDYIPIEDTSKTAWYNGQMAFRHRKGTTDQSRPSAYVDYSSSRNNERILKDSKGRKIPLHARPSWVSAYQLHGSVEQDSAWLVQARANQDRRMATALDMARKAVTLNLPMSKLYCPAKTVLGKNNFQSCNEHQEVLELSAPVSQVHMQEIIQAKKCLQRPPERDAGVERVSGKVFIAGGQEDHEIDISVNQTLSIATKGPSMETTNAGSVEEYPANIPLVEESKVTNIGGNNERVISDQSNVSKTDAVRKQDIDCTRQRAVQLVIKGVLQALKQSDGHEKRMASLRLSEIHGSNISNADTREECIKRPVPVLKEACDNQNMNILKQDTVVNEDVTEDVYANTARNPLAAVNAQPDRENSVDLQMAKIVDMEHRLTSLMESLDLRLAQHDGPAPFFKSRNYGNSLHSGNLHECLQALEDMELKEQAIRKRWITSTENIETKMKFVVGRKIAAEGRFASNLPDTDHVPSPSGLPAVSCLQDSNVSVHESRFSDGTWKRSVPALSDVSLASIKEHRKKNISQKHQSQNDVLQHGDLDCNFSKLVQGVADLLVGDVIQELSSEMLGICDAFAKALFEQEWSSVASPI